MKTLPCDSEALALLAADVLPPADAGRLRQHLAVCPRCEARYRQLAATCAAHHSAARNLPVVEVSESVLRRVGAAVRGGRTESARSGLVGAGRRWAWAVAGAVACGLVLLIMRREPPSTESVARPVVAASARTAGDHEGAGPAKAGDARLLVLRQALNRSDAALDGLLTVQASGHLRESTPVYRAGQWTAESDL